MSNLEKLIKVMLVCCWVFWGGGSSAQETLDLYEFFGRIQQQSPQAKVAIYELESVDQRLRSHQAALKPQLTIFGQLPDFTRSLVEAPQPNGTIDFQSVSTNNMIIGAEISQQILQTGTTISLGMTYQRFDDFDRKSTLFNGQLLNIGISQPLFGFNALKWENRIMPLRHEAAQLNYTLDITALFSDAADTYFDLLGAQVNLRIANENVMTNDTLYRIGEERFELGKIAENELLQLQFEQLQSKKVLSVARRQYELAHQNVLAMLMTSYSDKIKVTAPNELPPKSPALNVLIENAKRYRPEQLDWRRRQLLAEREVAQTHRENGPAVELEAGFGLSNRGSQFNELYKEPQDQEYIRLSFGLPIVDWGKAKAEKARATATLNVTHHQIKQERRDFERDIVKAFYRYQELRENQILSEQALEIATSRYQIAKQRFLLGNMSITDLNLAASERNRAQQEFLQSTRTLWLSFFNLQELTLYDFKNGGVLSF